MFLCNAPERQSWDLVSLHQGEHIRQQHLCYYISIYIFSLETPAQFLLRSSTAQRKTWKTLKKQVMPWMTKSIKIGSLWVWVLRLSKQKVCSVLKRGTNKTAIQALIHSLKISAFWVNVCEICQRALNHRHNVLHISPREAQPTTAAISQRTFPSSSPRAIS